MRCIVFRDIRVFILIKTVTKATSHLLKQQKQNLLHQEVAISKQRVMKVREKGREKERESI